MKIPKKFTLGAVEWEVRQIEDLGDNLGSCNHETGIIFLKKNPHKDILNVTFCHELIHALLYNSGRLEDHDEVLVEGLARGLHQYLEQND
jgi:hypothetical protein